MKQFLSLFMALTLAGALLAGCGCAKQDTTSPAEQSQQKEETKAPKNPSSSGLPAVSENKEVVSAEKAPKVVLMVNPETDADNITYHLENCPLLEGKEVKEASWELIKTIGFWQCPQCNPPRYEDYRNAQ